MKRILIPLFCLIAFVCLTAETCYSVSAAERSSDASAKVATSAIDTIPVPNLSYFQERRPQLRT
jgi:hypothetical protein